MQMDNDAIARHGSGGGRLMQVLNKELSGASNARMPFSLAANTLPPFAGWIFGPLVSLCCMLLPGVVAFLCVFCCICCMLCPASA